MPELPEVETIARILRPELIGRRIVAAQVYWPRTLAAPATPAEFGRALSGETIESVSRRAKYLLLLFKRGNLLIHLRMSGDLRFLAAREAPGKHDRLTLTLDNGRILAFNDPRKFGRIWFLNDAAPVLGRLGPEPLEDNFSAEWLYAALQARHRQLKPLLLDQTFLAGLGNIYTDEALHLAGLHPARISATISTQEAVRLHQAIRAALTAGIDNNGASIDWVYRGGSFQNHFRVYGRTGQPCPVCGAPIQRIVIGQRGTHFCPACQLR
ncbi:MAG: DNA-formamidopyrimidine glycosylase [Anaerolineae bacterium CG_4_9_14_3_um_filter_57_17]|nr:bifunctional DNA-formamidopyrimidine glycosylase/DNA-(apurinic or apyrimidinic site) lyase [bacterium]NCT20955.1 bifunctional DNA-formamidopyrimidine glycosylase/DNA-(apurinic or apyrimidinic site) lyase [bacterium]OIO85075.1 MAG: DNA-formamidopyrimidine glycosylase [Anaerolineae bacterium CG2_30_57_67]PJB68102.1 MAG: DNA-formamidopyrimidine glycosylase [Anaerolineae bacterium CG_4_9_14_3_um_filter_57_17]